MDYNHRLPLNIYFFVINHPISLFKYFEALIVLVPTPDQNFPQEKFVMKVTEIREEENEKSLLDDYEFMTEEDMKAANFSECLKKMFHNWVLVKYSHNCWNDWSCFQLGVIHVYFSLPPLFQPCQLNASSSGNVSRVSSNFAKADPSFKRTDVL